MFFRFFLLPEQSRVFLGSELIRDVKVREIWDVLVVQHEGKFNQTVC